MKKLKFDVFIGHPMISGQNDSVVAVVSPRFLIPFGKCRLDGSETKAPEICFQNLYDLGTYFADWIDLLGEEIISATVHLNTLSNKKLLLGTSIIALIDKIAETADYKSIKSFEGLQ